MGEGRDNWGLAWDTVSLQTSGLKCCRSHATMTMVGREGVMGCGVVSGGWGIGG